MLLTRYMKTRISAIFLLLMSRVAVSMLGPQQQLVRKSTQRVRSLFNERQLTQALTQCLGTFKGTSENITFRGNGTATFAGTVTVGGVTMSNAVTALLYGGTTALNVYGTNTSSSGVQLTAMQPHGELHLTND